MSQLSYARLQEIKQTGIIDSTNEVLDLIDEVEESRLMAEATRIFDADEDSAFRHDECPEWCNELMSEGGWWNFAYALAEYRLGMEEIK